jgi:hypothetical protein
MGYKYIVKTFYWQNNTLQQRLMEFVDEASAVSYALSANPAETVKVYVDDEVILSEQKQSDMYA